MNVFGADFQDCFYACHMPLGLTEFFCLLQDISVSELYGVTGGDCPEEFLRLGGQTRLSPCLKVLPMGFSWSFYLVQQLHEQIIPDSLQIQRSNFFLHARPAPRLRAGECVGMPYCNNVHVLGTDVNTAEKHRVKVCDELRSRGFTVHEEQPAASVVQTLGGVVDGDSGIVSIGPKRMWNLILAFEDLGGTKRMVSSVG